MAEVKEEDSSEDAGGSGRTVDDSPAGGGAGAAAEAEGRGRVCCAMELISFVASSPLAATARDDSKNGSPPNCEEARCSAVGLLTHRPKSKRHELEIRTP